MDEDRTSGPPDLRYLRQRLRALEEEKRRLQAEIDRVQSGSEWPLRTFDSEPGSHRPAEGVVAEKETAEHSARHLRAILDSATDYAIIAFDLGGRVTTWSTGAERIFGYGADEIVGRSAAILFTPEDRAQGTPAKEMDEALRAGRADDTRAHLCKDGSRFWASGAMMPVRDGSGQASGFVKVLCDITARKKSEMALRAAIDRAEALAAERSAILGQLAEGVIVTDLSGRIVYVNEAAARLHGTAALGVPPEAYTEAYRLFTEDGRPYPPEDLPLARAVRDGETVQDARWRIRRPDDTEAVAIGSAGPVRSREGAIIGAVLTMRDDTARHAAETALRESEARLRTLADNLPSGFVYQIAMRPDGTGRRFVYISQNCERLTGIPVDAALEDPDALYGLVMPEHRVALATAEDAAIRNRTPLDFVVALQRADGTVLWGRLISAPRTMPDGSLVWDGMLVDITERKQAERVLLEAQARYRAIIDTAIDAIVVIDERGRIRAFNKAAEAMFGYSAPGVIGRNVSLLMAEPDRSRHDQYLANYFTSGQARIIGIGREVRGRRSDGSTFLLDLSIAEWWSDGRRFFTGIMRDVTERKRAEQRQKLLLAELDHRVKNTLATVQSIAAQTLRTAVSPEAFLEAFRARLAALSQTHSLLTRSRWQGAALRDLLLLELAPYRGDDRARVVMEGADLHVGAKAALALGLVFHELATNAAKHGALSSSAGRVLISWTVDRGIGDEDIFRLTWTEHGGPPIAMPQRLGFGSTLIERSVAHELDGAADLAFKPDGLRCTIEVPLTAIDEDRHGGFD